MDAWDPSLVATVAYQLADAHAPRNGSSLRAFLELWHSFAITSRFLREKPLGECITALHELVAARKDIPAPVHRCLAISAPPNEALACAVTVASALYAGDIAQALVGRLRDIAGNPRDIPDCAVTPTERDRVRFAGSPPPPGALH